MSSVIRGSTSRRLPSPEPTQNGTKPVGIFGTKMQKRTVFSLILGVVIAAYLLSLRALGVERSDQLWISAGLMVVAVRGTHVADRTT